MSNFILAAGAVLWRKSSEEKIEVALIHRPKYDDWSFPKGKVEIGESLIACVFREVFAETGVKSELGPFLGEVEYVTIDGAKRVSYWSAKALSESAFTANSEVDEIKWIDIKKVEKYLTLDTDKKILNQFKKIEVDTKPLILLRHAKAITKDEWQGDDDDRPLDSAGQIQAKRLLSIYESFNLKQIHTSDAIRCYDTVDPISKALGIKLEVTSKLSESSYKKDKEKAIEYAKDLLKEDLSIMLCSHNPILPKMLSKLIKKSDFDADEGKLMPADSWVIHRLNKVVTQIDRLDAPNS